MKISSRVLRVAFLMVLLTLTFLSWSPPNASASCANGSNQWVRLGGVCCINTQKWKGQSCIFGVWTDNGATQCSGPCAI